MGFVARHPDPDDRRATVVQITDTGREAMLRNRTIIDNGLQAVWAEHVTDDEAQLIVDVMNRVMHARKSAD